MTQTAKSLIAYATLTGSTAEIAQAIAEDIIPSGLQVKILPFSQVKQVDTYAGVVIGSPMLMGWHRSDLGFLSKHRRALQRIPWVVFVTAMSLIRTGETSVEGVPVFVDENLPKAPEKEGHLSFRER